MQFSLLPEPEVLTLVDDASGYIAYKAIAFEPDDIRAWFDHLRDAVAWRSERMWMYDRVVDLPRLVASYDLDDPSLPSPIRQMQPVVEDFCKVRFTSAGLNFYRDGNDSVAPHGDHVERGPEEAPVALVSLGATRRMTIRSKGKPRKIFDRDLDAGSLLVMSYASHDNYDHGIPKTKELVGQRISVAFRLVPNEKTIRR